MRLGFWLLVLTIAVVAFATVDAVKKPAKKDTPEESAEEDKVTSNEADDDEDEVEEKKQSNKKKTGDDGKDQKKKTEKKAGKEEEEEEEDDDDDEDSDENYKPPKKEKETDSDVGACEKYGPCVCFKKKLDCDDAEADDSDEDSSDADDDTFYDQPSKLDSANVNLPSKFRPYVVSFKRNAIKQLRKGKVVKDARDCASHLRFNDNNISYIEPGTFQEFKNLTSLSLANNQLKELHKSVFEGLEKLEFLDLSGNGLTNIPKKVFKDLKKLKTLILDNNKIVNLDQDAFYGLSSLKKLSLDNCGFDDDALNITVFNRIEDTLEEVSLTGNPMKAVPRAIDALGNLKAFDLSGTQLLEIDEDSFSDDHNVTTILMRNMPFLWRIGDCAFCGLKQLTNIDFSKSPNLYMIHENAFGYVKTEVGAPKNLTQVNFEQCNFTTFPEDLLPWKELSQSTGLQIGGNPFLCDCDLLHLLSDEVFAEANDKVTLIPTCSNPARLAGKPLAAVNLQEEHCVSESRVQRFAYWLALLIMLVALSFAVYLVLTSRQLSALIHRHPIQDIRYSHVGREDVQNLETDFQPRSADP